MALELIQSGFGPSFDAPALVFNCEWELDGVRCYTSVILHPDLLCSVRMWNEHFTQVARWYRHKQRKNGEIACLPTFQST